MSTITKRPTPAERLAHSSGQAPCLILGYDGSASARKAASWAVSELLPDGKLIIVCASRPLHAPPTPLLTTRERARLARASIDELLLAGEDSLYDIQITTEVSDNDPVNALIDAAERHRARAIVVGSEPHSPLRKALGTVTTELMRRSPVPVITVPSPS